MRIHVLSDLHLESGIRPIPSPACDVVVLAGDIHEGAAGLDWAQRNIKDRPVVYVAGNHEFWWQDMDRLLDRLAEKSAGSNVKFLENAATKVGEWTFLGCTLWTDFCLQGDSLAALRTAYKGMDDYEKIKLGRELLVPVDTQAMHRASLRWLSSQLGQHNPAKTVIVTHHAPSGRSSSDYHKDHPLNPCFASALDKFVADSGVPLWIHGHTHHCVDYTIGQTRVLSNQRRYDYNEDPDFRPGLVVEI